MPLPNRTSKLNWLASKRNAATATTVQKSMPAIGMDCVELMRKFALRSRRLASTERSFVCKGMVCMIGSTKRKFHLESKLRAVTINVDLFRNASGLMSNRYGIEHRSLTMTRPAELRSDVTGWR